MCETGLIGTKRPLSFLHISTFYPPYSFGGDAIYLYRLCHLLADQGHSVDVIHCLDSYRALHPGEPEVSFETNPKVKQHGLFTGYGLLSPLWTQQTGRVGLKYRHVREVLDRKHYDVIHYHNISLFGPEILTLCPKLGRAIKVYTTHEHWLICPTHALLKYGRRPCESPKCFACTLRAKRPPQLWRYTNQLEKASQHVDQFLAPSHFTARMHQERGFQQPLDCLPYFVEPVDEEWKSPPPRAHKRPYFLFVGRLELLKGLQDLIRVWDSVPNVDLLVAGTGEREAELRNQARANPSIRFLGGLSQKQLGRLYVHALACIVPSITYESFGIVIIESFARKTPVIVRDLGALPEVIEQSRGGLVFRSDEELISALRKIQDCSGLRQELGENGYRAFRQRWSSKAHLRLYSGFLRKASIKRFGFVPWENSEAAGLRPAGGGSI